MGGNWAQRRPRLSCSCLERTARRGIADEGHVLNAFAEWVFRQLPGQKRADSRDLEQSDMAIGHVGEQLRMTQKRDTRKVESSAQRNYGPRGPEVREPPQRRKIRGWVRCKPHKLNRHVDTAGAGDWCTAGSLSVLGRNGANAFNQIGTTKLLSAISFGQALAAWNCGFHGARGGMYLVSTDEKFQQALRQILDQGGNSMPDDHEPKKGPYQGGPRVCSECRHSARALTGRPLLRLLHG